LSKNSPAVGTTTNDAQGSAGESDSGRGVNDGVNGTNGFLSSVRVGLLDRLAAVLGAGLALVVGPRIACQSEDND
jgi:hypothetical protein